MAKRKRKNRPYARRKRGNPGRGLSLRRPMGALTAGFKMQALTDAAILTGGAFVNMQARNAIVKMLPQTWSENNLALASYGVGIAGAGLLLLVPKVGGRLFAGAMAGEGVRLLTHLMASKWTRFAGSRGINDNDDLGQNDLDEFATVNRLPGGVQGIDEYATVNSVGEEELAGVDMSQ